MSEPVATAPGKAHAQPEAGQTRRPGAVLAAVASVLAVACAMVPAVAALPVPSVAVPRLIVAFGFGSDQLKGLQAALPAAALAAIIGGLASRWLRGWPVLLGGGLVLATGDLLVGAASNPDGFRSARLVQGVGAGAVLAGALAVSAGLGRTPRARALIAAGWAAILVATMTLAPLEQVRLASDGARSPFKPLWPLLVAAAGAAAIALLAGAARPTGIGVGATQDAEAPPAGRAALRSFPDVPWARGIVAVPVVLAVILIAYRLLPTRLAQTLTPLVPLLLGLAVLAGLAALTRGLRPTGGVAAFAAAGPVGAALLPLLLIAPGILGLAGTRSTLASARVALGPGITLGVAALAAGLAAGALLRPWPGLAVGPGALAAAAGAFALLPVRPDSSGLSLVPAAVLLGAGGGLAIAGVVSGGPRPGRDGGLGVGLLLAGLVVGTAVVAVLSGRSSDQALADVGAQAARQPRVVGAAVRAGALDGDRQAARYAAGLLAVTGFVVLVDTLRPREEEAE